MAHNFAPVCAAEKPASVGRRDILATFTLATGVHIYRESAFAQDAPPLLGSSRRPVVVVGAGGKLGKEVVLSLLRKGGYGVRATARGELSTDALGSADFPADDVDVLTGVDVTKPETLKEALAGAGAVIVCTSASSKGGQADAVDCLGVENVGKAAIEAGVERLVVVSSLGVTRPDSMAFKITNGIGNIMDYKEQGEERLRRLYKGQDKLSYTIIRPGGLKSGSPKGLNKLLVLQGDTAFSEIDRADVAEVAVASVFRPETKMATFEVFQREVKPLSDSFKDSMSAVSGPHKTDAAFEINEVLANKQNAEAWGELFKGLKTDEEYDASNGYKPLKPVP